MDDQQSEALNGSGSSEENTQKSKKNGSGRLVFIALATALVFIVMLTAVVSIGVNLN